MKCKACNIDFTPHYRVLPGTGIRALEDLCSGCRRGVYLPPKYTEERPDPFLDTVKRYVKAKDTE